MHKDIINWRPPRLSELTPIIFNIELAHLGSEASNYIIIIFKKDFLIQCVMPEIYKSNLSVIGVEPSSTLS